MITLLHAYGDLMNLYGDYANLLLLQKRLVCAGQEVQIKSFSVGEDISLTGCDLLYLGAGTEKAMLAALHDIREHADEIKSFAAFGGHILCTGNATALLGRSVTTLDGAAEWGVGLYDADFEILDKRRYAEYILQTPLIATPVIGAINNSLTVTDTACPAFTVLYATVPGIVGKLEGFLHDNVIATQLCGPLLVRNPAMLDTVAARLCGGELPACEQPWYQYAALGYESALETLLREKAKGR